MLVSVGRGGEQENLNARSIEGTRGKTGLAGEVFTPTQKILTIKKNATINTAITKGIYILTIFQVVTVSSSSWDVNAFAESRQKKKH
jgi:hypothetical protein